MANDLISRVNRIYSAIKGVEETDVSKFMPKVVNDSHRISFYQDWSGGHSNEDLTNIAHILIHNIANLKNHLRKWAAHNGKDKTKVDFAFRNSQALKLIMDLSDNDKHGYDPNRGGHSKKSPRIDKIGGRLQLITKPEKGSIICLKFSSQGAPKTLGNGTAKIIFSGDILDRDGNNIGDLHKTALEAVEVWERVLGDFGVTLSST